MQRETDKLSNKRNESQIEKEIKMSKQKDETELDKDRNKFKGKNEKQQDQEGKSQKEKKLRQRDREEKLRTEKDDEQPDREGIILKDNDEILKTKEKKLQRSDGEMQRENQQKQEENALKYKDQIQGKYDIYEKKQINPENDVDVTQTEKERKIQKEKENMKSYKEENVSKETQMQRDEKGKRLKETQTHKSQDKDEKQKENEEKPADKEEMGKYEKITEREAKLSEEKRGKSGTKQKQLREDKDNKLKEKEEKQKQLKLGKDILAKEKLEEKLKQDEAKILQKDQETLVKVADKVFTEALKRKQEQDKLKNKQADALKKARELANEAAVKRGFQVDPLKLLELKDFAPKHPQVGTSEIEFDKKKIKPHNELNVKEIILKKPSCDDLSLMLVKIKKMKDKKTKDKDKKGEIFYLPNFEFPLLKIHQEEHSVKVSGCPFCDDSDLSLDIGSLTNRVKEINEIIRGEEVVKYRHLPIMEAREDYPLIFKTTYHEENLSVGTFPIEETPTETTVYTKTPQKMNIYRMRPAHPEYDWFKHNKNKQLQYDTGEMLADSISNGRGRWFYRNGRVALDYYDAEDVNAHQRYVVYSSGELDERGHSYPITILATFDYSGNGVVFDHKGKIRLKYNQTEGIVLDRTLGPVTHWKWHSLNDPPQLQQVMIDTQMSHKDPEILKFSDEGDPVRAENYDEDMVAIEFDNFIKEKNKTKMTGQKFKPFQIKMKALKINDQFSLRVLDQATIYLMYRDGTTNLKLNLGMLLDNKEIVDTDTDDVGMISNTLERLPAHTNSIMDMQKRIEYAKQVQRLREEHENRVRPQMATVSVEQLAAVISRPLRPVLLAVPSRSKTTVNEQLCKCNRKPLSTNLYYNTRLI